LIRGFTAELLAGFRQEFVRPGDTLNSDPTFDSDFFQKLLASAFAVQECGVKPQLLAAIVELQRSIRTGDLDTEGTMRLVAEWARGVDNASGVAMGRLKGDELIYTAGSGSAASYVGRRVMATFSRSARSETKAEILRVENTEADNSIESAICRQFGVKSLLILPIFFGRSVAGVMQVHFNEAHWFDEQEVRIYGVLAGLVGEAMSQKTFDQRAALEAAALETIDSEPVTEPVTEEETEVEVCHLPAPPRVPAEVVQSVALTVSRAFSAPLIPLSESSRRFFEIHPAQYFPAYKRARITALVAASIILVFTWTLYATRPTETSPTQALLTPKPVQPAPISSTLSPGPGLPASPAQPQISDRAQVRFLKLRTDHQDSTQNYRIKHFGEDVTVRYFDSKPATPRVAAQGRVRRVSEDVTVRYFGTSANEGHKEAPTLVR
jgi:hypothetical protein